MAFGKTSVITLHMRLIIDIMVQSQLAAAQHRLSRISNQASVIKLSIARQIASPPITDGRMVQ